VSVHEIATSRVRGAAVAASEGSEVELAGLEASDVSLGVIGKDWSTVRAQDVRIAQAWAAGFAAYTETLPFSRARIDAQHVTFADDSPQAWAQAESSVTIDGVAVVAYDLDMDVLRSRQRAVSAMHRLDYHFGQAIALLGYELVTPEPAPGDRLVFTLYWTALAALERDYTVFVHVLDAEGQVAVGWDNMPAQDAYPTTRWRVGRLVEDTHVIPLPSDLAEGAYAVSFGLYYVPTGERLPLYDAAGKDVTAGRILLDPPVRVGAAQ
jgi:hypothetical protein